MGCGGHDIQPGQDSLHQSPVQVLVIAPRSAEAPVHGTLRGRQQGPGAAGEVRNPQPFDRGPVRPVHAQPLDRQFREQASGLGQCVEGGQELSVRDEGLEHPTGEVVKGRRTQQRQVGDGLRDAVHDRRAQP